MTGEIRFAVLGLAFQWGERLFAVEGIRGRDPNVPIDDADHVRIVVPHADLVLV